MIVFKKRLLAVLILLMTLSLSSCLVNTGGDDTDDDGSIYGSGQNTQIVMKEDQGLDASALADRIEQLCGKRPEVAPDTYGLEDHEIVIGDTQRTITADAKRAMEGAIEKAIAEIPEAERKWYMHYMIYSDGVSVAIVWTDEVLSNAAMQCFFDEYLTDASLKLDAGHEKIFSMSKIEYMRTEENAAREATYARLAEELGEDTVQALRAHFSIYDDRFYLWLADLYDPGEYDEDGNPLGGGFYYSNSARDNQGYLIDLESTQQALSFLSASGMMRGYGNDHKKAIPERMQKELLAFAYSCQSPYDGYFYHPQWGEAILPSRLSRDLTWATALLRSFGCKPYWNAPNGTEGMYGEPGVSKTTSIGAESMISAVAKVVSAAANVDKWPERLRTLENWQAYLDGFEATIHTNSYSIGNTIESQRTQIKNRDAEAEKNGEPTGYIEITREHFDRWQNPDNGLWEPDVSYRAVNGLMKISAVYDALSLKLNYAEQALNSAIEICLLTEADIFGAEATGSVDVYNPWITISRILNLMRTFGEEEKSAALTRILRENAAEMIRVSTRKTVKFRKDDGSYGYTWNYSLSSSQGVPVAVPNTVEGDVNGGTIALTGVTVNMLEALDIDDLYIYDPSDFEIFIDRAASLSHVLKDEIIVEVDNDVIDFEDSGLGDDIPARVSTSLTSGYAMVVEGGFNSDKALEFVTIPDKGDRVIVKSADTSGSKSCYVMEWDMCFDDIRASTAALQISLGNMYILKISVNTNGQMTFGDISAANSTAVPGSFPGSFTADEWHHVRVEHYRTDGAPLITCLYIDGEFIGISNNYYGKEKGTYEAPHFRDTDFYALYAADYTLRYDNMYTESNSDIYDGYIPAPYDGFIDFEDAEVGPPVMEGLSVKPNPEEGNSIEIAEDPLDDENLALKLTAKPSTTAGNWINLDIPKGESSGTYQLEMDVYVDKMGANWCSSQIYFYGGSKTVFSIDVSYTKVGDGIRLTVDEKAEDKTVNGIILSIDQVIESYFTLVVKYDINTNRATVTVITEEDVYEGTTGAYFSEATKSLAVEKISFYTLYGTDIEMYFDNIKVSK